MAPKAAVIAMQLHGADLSFEWRFEGLPSGRTRISQRVVLRDERAGAYRRQVESTFLSTLPEGMKKIATAMATSEARHKNAG
jgi:hypothetical protein